MLTPEELAKLAALLNHLHQCLGMKFALMDQQAREVYTASTQADFCALVKSGPQGLARCTACDREALRELTATQKLKKYRCHAGLWEVAMPVTENGKVQATILFGQFLGEGSREALWLESAPRLSWHEEPQALRREFLRLKQISDRELFSLTEIIHACISEVRLQGLLAAAEQSDGDRLASYIRQHYAQPLNLSRLCAFMHMGKTKLCTLCRQAWGLPPGQLLLKARMEAAQELLATTDYPVQAVAELVGIPDANYFTKCFKRYTGQTPGAYRQKSASPP